MSRSTIFGLFMTFLAVTIIILGFRLIAVFDTATRYDLAISAFMLGFLVAGLVFNGLYRWW